MFFFYSESLTMLGFYCRTSVAHMDSPNVVEVGLTQMLSLFVDPSAILDVFLLKTIRFRSKVTLWD